MPNGSAGTPLAKIVTDTKVCALAVSNYDSSVAISTSKGGLIIVRDPGSIRRSGDKGFQHPEKTVLQRGGRCISSLIFTHHNEVINTVGWRVEMACDKKNYCNKIHYMQTPIDAVTNHSKRPQVFGLS